MAPNRTEASVAQRRPRKGTTWLIMWHRATRTTGCSARRGKQTSGSRRLTWLPFDPARDRPEICSTALLTTKLRTTIW